MSREVNISFFEYMIKRNKPNNYILFPKMIASKSIYEQAELYVINYYLYHLSNKQIKNFNDLDKIIQIANIHTIEVLLKKDLGYILNDQKILDETIILLNDESKTPQILFSDMDKLPVNKLTTKEHNDLCEGVCEKENVYNWLKIPKSVRKRIENIKQNRFLNFALCLKHKLDKNNMSYFLPRPLLKQIYYEITDTIKNILSLNHQILKGQVSTI